MVNLLLSGGSHLITIPNVSLTYARQQGFFTLTSDLKARPG